MESNFVKKVIPIEPGDIVRRGELMMDLYMVSNDGDAYHLTDLSSGEILDFGTYSAQSLVDVAKLILVCKNEDLYITNKK